jgi:hypothetical protein
MLPHLFSPLHTLEPRPSACSNKLIFVLTIVSYKQFDKTNFQTQANMKLFKTMLFFVVAFCMAAMTSATTEAKDATTQGERVGLRGAVDGSVKHRGLFTWYECKDLCKAYMRGKQQCIYCPTW